MPESWRAKGNGGRERVRERGGGGGRAAVKRTEMGKTCAEAVNLGEKRTKMEETCAEEANLGKKRTKTGKTCAKQEKTKKELRMQLLEKTFREKASRGAQSFSHSVNSDPAICI